MIKKIIKLFGIKVCELEIYKDDDVKPTKKEPEGKILDYTTKEKEQYDNDNQ